jgi:hypothetical protein
MKTFFFLAWLKFGFPFRWVWGRFGVLKRRLIMPLFLVMTSGTAGLILAYYFRPLSKEPVISKHIWLIFFPTVLFFTGLGLTIVMAAIMANENPKAFEKLENKEKFLSERAWLMKSLPNSRTSSTQKQRL